MGSLEYNGEARFACELPALLRIKNRRATTAEDGHASRVGDLTSRYLVSELHQRFDTRPNKGDTSVLACLCELRIL